MKKVLIISSYPAPYRVGVFKEIARYYDVDLFFATNKNEDRNSDWFVKSGELKFIVINDEESKSSFRKALRNIKQYDFVIPYDPIVVPSRYAIVMCRLKGVPYFVNCDGAIIKENFVRDLIKRYLFSGATGCFASGSSAIDYFLHYGVKREKIAVHKFTSVNEDDIIQHPLSKAEKNRLRRSLGLEEKNTVVSIGQFIYRKGFDILLNAWKNMKTDNAQLVIIGGGSERANYEKFINENKMSNVVILDFMQKKQLIQYYDASDIFVLPTREDIWGLVINESMARGLPVVTTDKCIAGIEMIENGENGFVVGMGNPEALAEKIEILLQDEGLREKMSKANIVISQGATVKDIAHTHMQTIERLLSGEGN